MDDDRGGRRVIDVVRREEQRQQSGRPDVRAHQRQCHGCLQSDDQNRTGLCCARADSR